jgi:hypothetical protein
MGHIGRLSLPAVDDLAQAVFRLVETRRAVFSTRCPMVGVIGSGLSIQQHLNFFRIGVPNGPPDRESRREQIIERRGGKRRLVAAHGAGESPLLA